MKFVFRVRRLQDRSTEFAAFVAVGLAGLVLTQAMLWLFVYQLLLAPMPAKLITASLVFFFNFAVRKALLFHPRRHHTPANNRLGPIL